MRRVMYGVVLTVLFAAVVTAAGPTDRGYTVDEYALKGSEEGATLNPNPRGTTPYSGTTVGGPEWDRPFTDFSGISGLGPVRYHEQLFYVGLDGAYDLSSVQTGSWDGYLLLYVDAFDPNNQLSNGVAGDDDGAGGIGTSEIVAVNLFAGRQYFLITTGFQNGDEGPFDNVISGPGDILLGPLGGAQGDLAITMDAPLGVVFPGAFTFELDVTNAGPDAQGSVLVTDVLPAALTYLSDSCGGVLAAGVWTWTIGDLAVGANAGCSVSVQMNTELCAAISNTAVVSGDVYDPVSGNNSATVSNGGGDAIADGGFEGGTPSAAWAEASTNFGSVLCTVGSCGTGTGTGPHNGSWWAWFGGVGAYEEGSLSQSVTLGAGAELSFWLEAIICDSPADYLEVTVDGTQVFVVNGSSPLCGTLGYSEQVVNLAPFDDGAVHTIEFHSEIFAANASGSNFFVDDVSLPEAPTCTTAASFDLALTKSATDNQDGTGAYELSVQNLGPDDATGVEVTDFLPAGVSYLSDTCGGSEAGGLWTWMVGNLANGASALCQVTVTIVDPLTTLNNASVSGVGDDLDPTNNVAAAVIPMSMQIGPAIPTLGAWGIVFLSLVLAAAGVLVVRRRF